ncbi:MAG TPA: biotin/lipoyl-binding protein, partial [Terriglobia bacterium]|nr:biotin/lipoyl-binding protein [Terriglobia bacterium]
MLLLLGGVVVVFVAGVFLWRHFSSYETTDDAQVDAHLYPISARISGYVVRVNVEDNEYVKEGTVLVEIDPKDYQVAVDQARADLANAVATAQSLHIDVPITTTTTSTQMQTTSADVENNRAGIAAA